jgi:multiple sugar transport system ATP-binding protein
VPIAAEIGRGHQDAPVIVGVRPEHIGNVADGAAALEITPTLVESLGGERYVHFPLPEANRVALASARGEEASGDAMIARIVGQTRIHAGEPIRLAIDTSQLRLFDPQTERALG